MFRLYATVLVVMCVLQGAYGQSEGDFRSNVVTGDYNVNTSWQEFVGGVWVVPSFSPSAAANLVTIQSGHTISLSGGEILNHVVVNGTLKELVGVTVSFSTVSGDAILVNGTFDVTGTITQTASSVIRVNGIFIARGGSTLTTTTSSNLIFAPNSVYQHAFQTSAGTIPLASWDPTSTLLIKGYTSNSTAPGNLGQLFGNVTFDLASGTTLALASGLTTIQGTLSTTSTNTRNITLGSGSAYSLAIGGDLSLNGGLVTGNTTGTGVLTTITVAGSFVETAGTFLLVSVGNATLNIAKNFTWSGGAFIKSGSGNATINFDGTQPQLFNNTSATVFTAINFSVSNGSTLDLTTTPLTGTGAFTLNAGATLVVGSTNSTGAIVLGSSNGNIRVSGTRTFAAGSTIVYNNASSTPIFMGSGQPTTAGVTTVIKNAGGVSVISTALTINGDVVLSGGDLNIVGAGISFGGTFTPSSNSLIAGFSTNLTITDAGTAGDFGLLKLAGGSIVGSLTLTGATGRTVRLGADLAVLTQLTLTAGNLVLNGFALNIQGAVSQTAGTITSDAASSLVISDETAGSLPADLPILGGAIKTITMDRPGEVLSISSPLTAGNVNIVEGTFTPAALTMATSGKITVTDGTLTNPVSAVSTYDVEYNSLSDISTGAELPVSNTTLDSLINSSEAVVTLSDSAIVNRALVLNSGFFVANGFKVVLNGDFISNGSSDFTASPFVFNGTTTISGDSIPDFGNVLLKKTKSLVVSQKFQMNVAGDFVIDGSFNPGIGAVAFNGSIDQSIRSTATNTTPVPFFQLFVNKPAGKVNVVDSIRVSDILRISSVSELAAGNNMVRLVSTINGTARVNPLPTGALISGTVIVERYLPSAILSRAYQYVAPPVTNSFVSDWQEEIPITGTFSNPSTGPGIISTNPSLFYYDESNVTLGTGLEDRYVAYPASGLSNAAPLVNGKGYALFMRSIGTTFDTRGTLAQQQQVITVTARSAGGNDGWNLIGNPYASPVHWDKVALSANVLTAVYIRDNDQNSGASLVTYQNGVATPSSFDGSIGSGQGIWVRAIGAGTVTFNEAAKIISSDTIGPFFRTSLIPNVFRLTMSGQEDSDETVIRFVDGATDDLDREYDASKLYNTTLNFGSQLADGRDLTINALGQLTCDRAINLSISNATDGNYFISPSGFESFGSDVDFYLFDKENGSLTNLRNGGYSFIVNSENKAALANRFKLQFNKTRLLTNLDVSHTAVCFTDAAATITVSGSQAELQYKTTLNGIDFTDWINGTGKDLSIPIATQKLPIGESKFIILIRNSCNYDTLAQQATIHKLSLPKVTTVKAGLACLNGQATLYASGAQTGQRYNWFETIDGKQAYQTETEGRLSLTGLKDSTAWYVSIIDSLGCQSNRTPVPIMVVDSVTITRSGDNLISNYSTGNQWYLGNVAVSSTSPAKLSIDRTGTYTVKVNKDGCATQASLLIMDLNPEAENFYIFPNPASDNINLYFQNLNTPSLCIDVISVAGISVFKNCLAVTGDQAELAIAAQSFAPGMYLIRITTDRKTFVRKVIKE